MADEQKQELSEQERRERNQADWDKLIDPLDDRDTSIFNEQYGHLARTGALTDPDFVPTPEQEDEIHQARRYLVERDISF